MAERKECPAGCVNGKIYRPGIDQEVPCALCLGRGFVEDICACGRPAFITKDDVKFCGLSGCLWDVKRELRESSQTHMDLEWEHRMQGHY